jgi:AcrR family transcriptional regulator
MITKNLPPVAARTRLLDAARELFAREGYQHVSIQDVLNQAGLSRGALYHHFKSKTDLFEAVLEATETEIAAALLAAGRGAGSSRDALRSGCVAWLDVASDPAVRQIALIDAPTAVGWERWREIDARHGFGMLRSALAHHYADGEALTSDLLDSYAHVLLAALLELGLLVAHADDPVAARESAVTAVDQLLDGLLPRH